MRRSHRPLALVSDAITVEGALIAPAILAKVATQGADEQKDSDYRIPKGLTLRDEIARYFRIGQALFTDLYASGTPSTAKTIGFVESLFRDVFGFTDLSRAGSRSLNGRSFAVSLEGLNGRVPIVVVPPADSLDRASDHLPTDTRRRSAASAVQDWLNAQEEALWGLCCNGERLRLLRDNASLTRPAYIEADLRQIFEAESFADFATLWLLIHVSRFGAPGAPATDCALERWREAGSKEGTAARDRLRDGVEAALKVLGSGFLSSNPELRGRVRNGELPLNDFFGQLLRLVYRLIFLLAAEDRGLLHAPDASVGVRELYARGYSLSSLRDRAVRRSSWDAHHDKWEGLVILFAALARGEKRLGLPALGGLFAADVMPELESAQLSNRTLMEAVYRLAWLREDAGLVPVNWRDMETEELGSVYESLLELTPRLADDERVLEFAEGTEQKGHARKTTGSYYTPDALVQTLLDSALDPVLEKVEAEADDPARALLGVTVIDPACGSGHFLLAAGRRIATRLARARSGGVASVDDYRHALRDVTRACLHGVDRNPMAVELTKVALWIETVDPGKPLGFLDANIRCGDALLGVFDMATLAKGIPEAAYKPLTGDDKGTAKYYATRNRHELAGQSDLFLRGGKLPPAKPLAEERAVVRAMPEDSPEQITEKRRRFEATQTDRLSYAWREAADLYVAAFLLPKAGGAPDPGQSPMVPTTGDVWRALASKETNAALVARAIDAARAAHAFHWPLEFPDIMASSGFDVVLGNPPWEVMQLGEEEYFAQRLPEIAELAGAARKRAIAALETERPEIFATYQADKRRFEGGNEFARAAGRFDLTATGKVNTYALFAELFSKLANSQGRSGIIVPTGIATDAANARFFAALIDGKRLQRMASFENEERIFPTVHHSFRFCLLTLSATSAAPEFAFFLRSTAQLSDPERVFRLSENEIANVNPTTKTAPIFRTRSDANLTTKIYGRVPTLGNPGSDAPRVDIVQNFFSTSNRDDMDLFDLAQNLPAEETCPVLRGKMIDQFDHCAATFDVSQGEFRDLRLSERSDPDFQPVSDKSVSRQELMARLQGRKWSHDWLIGWRDITSAHVLRTMISAAFPAFATDDTLSLLLPEAGAEHAATLIANLNCLTLDFVARQKVGGTHIRKYIIEQLPVIPRSAYRAVHVNFIVPRVLELTYTSHAMAPFARDLGYEGKPFAWNEDRRAHLRAELDAFFARAYGLTRDELRYVLDPEDAMGPGYPSETFRVLKTNEIRRFGEYRTARLVLDAWDRIERGELPELAADATAKSRLAAS